MSVEERIFVQQRRVPPGDHRSPLPIGQILLRSGKLVEGDIPRVITAQRQGNCRFGDAACNLGLVTELDIQQALSNQLDYFHLEGSDSRLSPDLIVAHQPKSDYAEALRRVRTALMLTTFSEQSKALAIVSA